MSICLSHSQNRLQPDCIVFGCGARNDHRIPQSHFNKTKQHACPRKRTHAEVIGYRIFSIVNNTENPAFNTILTIAGTYNSANQNYVYKLSNTC